MSKHPGSISAIILTKNEGRHLKRILDCLSNLCEKVYLIDSGSTDDTISIAESYPYVEILRHTWVNYSTQFNWALENCPVTSEWTLRIDADEYFTEASIEELLNALPKLTAEIKGVYLPRRMHFLGRWMKHGGVYPMWVLRLWRTGYGRCENRWMDEHIIVDGKSARIKADFIDDCLKDLSFWTAKHNGYSTREMVDMLALRGLTAIEKDLGGLREQAWQKRWLKERVYAQLPLFVRPTLYFIYRYVFRLGFLDGREGFIFSFLQAFWYRFLVDSKIYEFEKRRDLVDLPIEISLSEK